MSTLTGIRYIGNEPTGDKGWAATICTTHGTREIATYVFQLEELECPVCVGQDELARREREARAEMLARQGHPSICLCYTCAPQEYEYSQQDAEEAARLFLGEIFSDDYCDHDEATRQGWGCLREHCRNARCKFERENPPF